VTAVEPPLVVLWDIDGTLMRSSGIGVRAFVAAIEEVTGRTWTPERLDFGGRTDPDIATLLLAAVGVDDVSLVPAVLEALVRRYGALDADLQATVKVMPGVVAALDALALPGTVQTVVTGNIELVARQKLTAARLVDRLRLEWGAYGSDDHADRAALVDLAITRVTGSGAAVDRERVWVVGDTPRDLVAARAAGVRCLLVGTGAHAYDDLAGSGADLVLPDLAALAVVLEALAPGGSMTIS
jgi:phosphoglycolate phosphatase-like HAD superfamily hydrolase